MCLPMIHSLINTVTSCLLNQVWTVSSSPFKGWIIDGIHCVCLKQRRISGKVIVLCNLCDMILFVCSGAYKYFFCALIFLVY